ncbi:hypothetical protein IFU39_16410 [Paenibacillus sp. CFBP 13594]|uniref:hypothetical protein n=1 Tax=Paenibacillus sp. CFBP 13594 TaxID=2774037 RepID=UPI00178268C0|nr:hypothetical protein [Paenibacillus sp. CFBP 13594]MBD8839396.1 hypothetical protein [Paenibacillus sp. CFBP 13594]
MEQTTVGYFLASKLKELHKKRDDISEEIDDVVADLCGAEIKYGDHHYCMIDHIFEEEVNLYCESEDGEQYEESITLDELIKCL